MQRPACAGRSRSSLAPVPQLHQQQSLKTDDANLQEHQRCTGCKGCRGEGGAPAAAVPPSLLLEHPSVAVLVCAQAGDPDASLGLQDDDSSLVLYGDPSRLSTRPRGSVMSGTFRCRAGQHCLKLQIGLGSHHSSVSLPLQVPMSRVRPFSRPSKGSPPGRGQTQALKPTCRYDINSVNTLPTRNPCNVQLLLPMAHADLAAPTCCAPCRPLAARPAACAAQTLKSTPCRASQTRLSSRLLGLLITVMVMTAACWRQDRRSWLGLAPARSPATQACCR